MGEPIYLNELATPLHFKIINWLFYIFEGKLATYPIINFLRRRGSNVRGVLVDLGCGKKPYKKFFPNVKEYIGVDKYNKEADLIEDAKETSIKSGSVDCVLCNQVIEHEKQPNKIICEAQRILKKNGVLLLSAPQMGRLHGEDEDYYRFTKWGLKYLIEKNGFKVISIKPHGGIFRAVGSHINFFIVEKFGINKYFKMVLRMSVVLFNNMLFGVLDRLIYWDKDTLGYNVEAIKK